MTQRAFISAIILTFPLLAISGFYSPETPEKERISPNYAEDRFWIALPWRDDMADDVPPDCPTPENQALAQADVFYVHPTMYVSGREWNADLEDKKVNGLCDTTVKLQATVFNSSARIFAPRYRQGHLRCFTREGDEAEDALDTAYADVKAAFEYYLTNWNNERPIILAGHSQGAYHIARLMEEYFDGKPLQQQLVAAYAIGFEIRRDRFRQIPVGDSASQTGCFLNWNTVKWGRDTTGVYKRYRGSACVNPLTWTQDTAVAPGSLHRGGVPFDFSKAIPHCVTTKIHGSLLWISFSDKSVKKAFRHLASNYHVSDVNLFYMNIRENAELRVRSFLRSREDQ